MRSIAIAIVACLLVFGAGCGDDEAPEDPTEPATITYSRSGGVAGIDETLTVRPDGSGEFERGSAGDSPVDRFQLEPSRHEELTEVVGELDFAALDAGQSATCADCFIYEISYGDSTLTADDVTAKPELRRALSALNEAIRTRPSH